MALGSAYKFLNYLHGSEHGQDCIIYVPDFLNYLHGSELNKIDALNELKFLNYLHGSELDDDWPL